MNCTLLKVLNMRKHFYLLTLTFFSSFSAFSATPIDGLYTSAFGGLSLINPNIDVSYQNMYLNQSKYSSGFDAGGAIGYKSAIWRYEVEVTYFDANINQIAVDNVIDSAPEGYNNGVLGFLNILLDIPTSPSLLLQPYIGAGIGYAWIQNQVSSTNSNLQFNPNNYSLTYQGTAGIMYNFAENYSLSASYHFMSTTHINTLGSNFQTSLINGAITYRFDDCEYK